MTHPNISCGVILMVLLTSGCNTTHTTQDPTQFTKLDSLTDIYLVLHDSVLASWNKVVRNEVDKEAILNELMRKSKALPSMDSSTIGSIQSRIEQLQRIRFTQKSMVNHYVVEEYDRACISLLEELVNLSANDLEIEIIIERIEDLQQSSYENRYYYDSLAKHFNTFVNLNAPVLRESGNANELLEKPLFWSASTR